MIDVVDRSRNVPAGHTVSFNGTDLITVNGDCLIAEVDSALYSGVPWLED